jgi:16S rRNA (uracil1498-N3)-methyltransferase
VRARFYAPDAESAGDVIDLPREEAEHLTRVLRLGTGSAVGIFNGRGREFDAVIERATKSAVRVRVGDARTPVAREARVAVTLAQAVLKSDKMDDVVRDAVMMGVAVVLPVVTARSETTLAAMARGRRVERWQRIAVASAKQCGRATVPPILEPRLFTDVPDALGRLALPGPGLMFVEPSATGDAIALGDLDCAAPHETTVFIGPEGGWTPEEIEQASAACRLVTLGGRTLRADAMAVVALAALFTRWKEL